MEIQKIWFKCPGDDRKRLQPIMVKEDDTLNNLYYKIWKMHCKWQLKMEYNNYEFSLSDNVGNYYSVNTTIEEILRTNAQMELTVECQSAEISDDNKVPKFDHEDEHKSPENNGLVDTEGGNNKGQEALVVRESLTCTMKTDELQSSDEKGVRDAPAVKLKLLESQLSEVNLHRPLCQPKPCPSDTKLEDQLRAAINKTLEDYVLKEQFKKKLAEEVKHLKDQIDEKLKGCVLKNQFEDEMQRQKDKLVEEQIKPLKELQQCLKNELPILKERLDGCEEKQCTLEEETTTKLGKMELRIDQVNDTIANLKREAKEEREKNIQIQIELEAQVKELQLHLENELPTLKERLDGCEEKQHTLVEEITTKLGQLELRNYQANESAIANMKREAKEEREKIIKTQKELEAQIKKMELELKEKGAEQEQKFTSLLKDERTSRETQVSEQVVMIHNLEKRIKELEHPRAHLCYGLTLMEGDKSQIHRFDIDDQDYRRIDTNFYHFHVKVFDECFRAIVLDIRKEGDEIIDIICKTFGIWNLGELDLCKKQKKSSSESDVHMQSTNKSSLVPIDPKKTLKDEIDDSFVKPYLLYLCRRDSEEVDTSSMDDIGLQHQQNPPSGDIEVVLEQCPTTDANEQLSCQQTERDLQMEQNWNFHVMWMGVVQGAYVIDRASAIKLAALLTLIYYYRDKDNVSDSLLDFNVEAFLPEMYRGDHGGHISKNEVLKECLELGHLKPDKQREEYIADVVTMCSKLRGCYGLFYDVAVIEKRKLMGVIPKFKTKQYAFGITPYGVVKINSHTGKVLFIRQFSDINSYGWNDEKNSFFLHFEGWNEKFEASSKQSREIIETFESFVSIIGKAKENDI